MAIYVVQAQGHDMAALERARFVQDGFSWPAFVLAQLWLLYHRLWLALLIWVVAEVAFIFFILPHVAVVTAIIVDVLARLCLGFEASWLRLARNARKTVITDVIEGGNRDEAEARFFQQYAVAGQAGPDEAADATSTGEPRA